MHRLFGQSRVVFRSGYIVCVLNFVLKLFTALDALIKWTFVIFACLQVRQCGAQGYGMMPQQMAMPMGAPVPQMETVNYRNGCNKNDCNNHDKTYSRRDMCPPCSCNPCTPAFFAWCSPCHEQCKCKDNDSPDRQTSTKAPNGNVYQMPIPPIIYVPLPDLNQPKCPRCRKRKRHKESSSSCSSDDSTDDSTSSDESSCDSRDSRSRRREKNRDKYDICRRNGDCGSQSDEYQRGRRLKVAKRKREHKRPGPNLGQNHVHHHSHRDKTRRALRNRPRY